MYHNSYIICKSNFIRYLMSLTNAWLFNNYGKNILSPKDLEIENKPFISVHSQVRKYLEELGHKRISSKLFELQNLRSKADYSLYPNLNEDDLEQAVETMKDIVTKLKNMDEV